jgi:UDP-N-acetylmuramate dehydrogenase
MQITKNISLKKYNTFALDYKADCIIRIKTEKEAISLFKGDITWKKPLLILGGGSNILFTSDFKGTILCPDIRVIRIKADENGNIIISAGAGIKWDKLVEWTVDKGYGGLENLSLIPGTVGAAAVQNIGAYGSEVKDVIQKVRTISIKDGTIRFFTHEECKFEYRNSIFKSRRKGEFLVTRVYFRLKTRPVYNLGYGSLKEEVKKTGEATLENVRNAVIKIRRSKLPDPEIIGNAGSFFKNPLVDMKEYELLKFKYPEMPSYDDISGGKKLAAGWMIEQCGWKGKRSGDAGIHEKQALVIVNHGNASGKDIYDLSENIRKSVQDKFGVLLEREVEVI